MRVEVLPGGACIGPISGSNSSFMSGKFNSDAFISAWFIRQITGFNVVGLLKVSGHPVLLLPVTKTEPESLSGDETDISEAHFEGVNP